MNAGFLPLCFQENPIEGGVVTNEESRSGGVTGPKMVSASIGACIQIIGHIKKLIGTHSKSTISYKSRTRAPNQHQWLKVSGFGSSRCFNEFQLGDSGWPNFATVNFLFSKLTQKFSLKIYQGSV